MRTDQWKRNNQPIVLYSEGLPGPTVQCLEKIAANAGDVLPIVQENMAKQDLPVFHTNGCLAMPQQIVAVVSEPKKLLVIKCR